MVRFASGFRAGSGGSPTVAKHRQEEEDGSGGEPTELLPVITPPRRHLVSPVLLGAGGVAVALVLSVGGWALVGSSFNGGPLVFPWSGETPGAIDVSVSMVPTVEPTLASPTASPVPSPRRRSSPRASAAPKILMSAEPVPPKSPSVLSRTPSPPATAMSASVTDVNGWDGNIIVTVDVKHTGAELAAGWTVDLVFTEDVRPDSVWNADVQAIGSRLLRFTAVRTLGPAQTVRFGFIAAYSGPSRPRLSSCKIDAQSFSCTEN
jgi:hypothetical protein